MKTFLAFRVAPPLIYLLIGYVPIGKADTDVRATEPVPFCAVAEHPETYRGKRLRLRATYSTDNSHYEYLKLTSCANNLGLIDIGKHGQSESVRAFYAETKKVCTVHQALAVCIISADVDVVGLIKEWPGQLGHFVIDLDEINQFKLDSKDLNK